VVNYFPEEPSTGIKSSAWEAHGNGAACPLRRPGNMTSRKSHIRMEMWLEDHTSVWTAFGTLWDQEVFWNV